MRKKRFHRYEAAVRETIRRRALLRSEDRVLVALSAGPDSTALLAVLAALRDAGELAAVAALHVDHGLRPGGAEDAVCAADSCRRLRVPFESVRVTVGSGNVQAAARSARYAALREACARMGTTRIATGHTRTDQAETVLLRLLRGAGARGLGAIPPRRGLVVRPLIDRSRSEGIRYLESLGIRWREDPTNASPRYARNRLRQSLWPVLLSLAPAAERALARAADHAREDERALARRARALAGGASSIDLGAMAKEPVAVRRRVVRALWRAAAGPGSALEASHVEAVLSLSRRSRPGRTALPRGLEARSRYGRIEMGPRPPPATPVPPEFEVTGPGRYRIPGSGVVEVSVARPGDLPWPLALRARRPGDRFRPEGGRGSKKLKAWLIDRKVPRETRDRLLLLAAGERVLAIPALSAVAEGLGPGGTGLVVRLEESPRQRTAKGGADCYKVRSPRA